MTEDTGDSPEAEALADLALDRWGHLLNAEQRELLRQAAHQQQAAIDTLRAFELRNADEPALSFAVTDREEERVHYFPSFEIATALHGKGHAEDGRHARDETVFNITSAFMLSHSNGKVNRQPPKTDEPKAAE